MTYIFQLVSKQEMSYVKQLRRLKNILSGDQPKKIQLFNKQLKTLITTLMQNVFKDQGNQTLIF